MSKAQATAQRIGDEIVIVCPHCHVETIYGDGWEQVFMFICSNCGEPVEVVESEPRS